MRWYIEGEATNNRPTDLSGFEVTRLGAHTHSIILPNFLSCSGQHNFYAPHTFGIDGTHRGPPHSTQELSRILGLALFHCFSVALWLAGSTLLSVLFLIRVVWWYLVTTWDKEPTGTSQSVGIFPKFTQQTTITVVTCCCLGTNFCTDQQGKKTSARSNATGIPSCSAVFNSVPTRVFPRRNHDTCTYVQLQEEKSGKGGKRWTVSAVVGKTIRSAGSQDGRCNSTKSRFIGVAAASKRRRQ